MNRSGQLCFGAKIQIEENHDTESGPSGLNSLVNMFHVFSSDPEMKVKNFVVKTNFELLCGFSEI